MQNGDTRLATYRGAGAIFLNKGELPLPERTDGTSYDTYDANGDGHFDLRDYAQDPRANPACPSGTDPFVNHQEGVTWSCVPGGQHDYLNSVDVAGKKTPYLAPEDLIVVFSNHTGNRKLIKKQGAVLFSAIFKRPGRFSYVCTAHAQFGMTGTLVVKR